MTSRKKQKRKYFENYLVNDILVINEMAPTQVRLNKTGVTVIDKVN